MFGMGFTEIMLIAVIAILFLGPDKLPETMVQLAKMFKSVKNTMVTAKASIEEEIHIADIKQEAMNYKKELTQATEDIKGLTSLEDLNDDFDEVKANARVDLTQEVTLAKAPHEDEEITFSKKERKPRKERSKKTASNDSEAKEADSQKDASEDV